MAQKLETVDTSNSAAVNALSIYSAESTQRDIEALDKKNGGSGVSPPRPKPKVPTINYQKEAAKYKGLYDKVNAIVKRYQALHKNLNQPNKRSIMLKSNHRKPNRGKCDGYYRPIRVINGHQLFFK